MLTMDGNYISLQGCDEIRLLGLLPGSRSDPIVCSLNHARLSERPKYEALSYMWGPETHEKTMIINSDNREIRENLWAALSHLRYTNRSRILWVDAICINQADTTERNHQVTQMGNIYKGASTVIIWLGEEDPSSKLAVNLLRINSYRDMFPTTIRNSPWIWKDIKQLCRRRYWSRLWIIQEVVMAANIMIQCGDSVIPWATFSRTLFELEDELNQSTSRPQTPRDQEPSFSSHLHAITASVAIKLCHERVDNKYLGKSSRDSILDIVKRYKDADCADARDKIFGLRELAINCCRTAVPVDYTCSAYVLCGTILNHHFTQHREGKAYYDYLSDSWDLHELIIKGAFRQQGTQNAFGMGSPRDLMSNETTNGMPSEMKISLRLRRSYQGHITSTIHSTIDCTPAAENYIRGDLQEHFWIPLPDLISKISGGCDLVQRLALKDTVRKNRIFSTSGRIFSTPRTICVPIPDGTVRSSPPGCPLYNNPKVLQEKTLLEVFHLAFLIQRKQLSQNNCLLFLGLDGLTEAGSGPIEVGDTACSINGSKDLAIVYKFGEQYRLIGIGLSLSSPRGYGALNQVQADWHRFVAGFSPWILTCQ
jgi:hypothetical protein